MIELPEAIVLSKEINDALSGKTIKRVVTAHSPHKFAWYHDEPDRYHSLTSGKTIKAAYNMGGFVRIDLNQDVVLLLSEGIRIKYIPEGEKVPEKHQLLLEFEDQSCLTCSIQMYGGLCAFHDGDYDNDYYGAARKKPSPLSNDFDEKYFNEIIESCSEKTSLKALLATEQRIPGLGNGILQDILFNSKFHPRKKIRSLSNGDKKALFEATKTTLQKMVNEGGRDTEKDIFGYPGGYKTILSKNSVGKPCPQCGSILEKQAYMGGSVYFCPTCQLM